MATMPDDDARPDSALTGLDGVPHTGTAVLADGHLVEPQAEDFSSARMAPRSPDWYKTAVFYEVLVRAFTDSNGDGTGDLRGLASKMDYLSWLGVDCLWLPPFYASRCATAATTSVTSGRCCPSSAPSRTSCTCSTRPTAGASG
ncbi:hypothetical protein GCM10029964_106870 [Kibdelosporangium lantanae]